MSSLLLVVGLLGGSAAGSPWHRTYEQAQALAAHTGKPLLVVFRCEH